MVSTYNCKRSINGIIVQNNPVNFVDPDGLWKFSIGAYYGYGAGLTFGRNPDGQFFASARGGYGVGAGWMFSPEGTSAGYDPCKEGLYPLLGLFGEAHVSQGPLYAGIEGEAGFDTGVVNGEDFDAYDNISPDAGFKNWGFKAGAAAGVEITAFF